ncbi:ATP-binding protein [Amphritea sp. 2_MG-2023]|uniref:hybrid sensor histidine kinase/response regulator n=1 Tax=Amphritea TaxID=515417 RepID=UPI001C06E7B2|nr:MULTISPECIES: ATP-binding protein [Amphritea]MBU2964090.1 PAS-domain containing protein [Amphritea atlantica]MDO6418488.1 ATP-binding protein [Amphritea sp. 2_MG-2023]
MHTSPLSPAIKTAHPDLADPDVWALLSSEASWLLDAIENIAEAFVYWGPDDRLVMCNSQYPSQFMEPDKVRPGVHFSELVEQNIRTGRVVRFNDIDDVPASPEAYREKRMAMHHSGYGTFEVENYSGKWLQARERKTRDGGTVGIYTDITGIKQAEQREHQAAIAEAQANQGKSRFLAAASHDLRQPLHAMGILVSALSGRLKAPEERDLLAGIDTCLNTMQSLFDSLLDISRLDAGVIEPEQQPLDLSQLLKHVEQEFSPQAQSKGLTLTVRGTAHHSFSDSSMLGRILRNLIANAIKYTDAGRVLVAVRPRAGALALEVWDTGIGFPTAQIDTMLGEFKQLEVGKVRRQGLGLGLSIASRLCNMLQHPLEIRSIEGRGSMFRVVIPLHQPSQTVEATAQPRQYADMSQRYIVVLDDDQDNLKATALLLRDWGCRVETAANLTEIEQIKHCPDLMLVDHHLSDNEKGTDAIDRLSAKFGKKIAGLVITGDTEPEQLQQIKAQGYPVVHKPLKPMKLRALLQQRFS